MALRAASRTEVGQRVAWLRKQAGLSGRDAALAIGIKDSGLFGRIELHGKSFDYERLARIAETFAGRGTLIDDDKELFDFIVWHGEVARVLRPNLRLMDDGNEPYPFPVSALRPALSRVGSSRPAHLERLAA